MIEPEIEVPDGFSYSSIAAGIKPSGRADLALISCCPGTRAAAVFTQNQVVAAPVQVGRSFLKASRGAVRAVIINSGNANCATGLPGLRACRKVCAEVARLLGIKLEQVFPASTGIIGVPLPVAKVLSALPSLKVQQRNDKDSVHEFAKTIMTTDTRPKLAWCRVGGSNLACRILGVAKGSGMIHPKLATMLVYLFTDANLDCGFLRTVLREVCNQTFNCLSIDGDTSTNDTVLLMASGKIGLSRRHRSDFEKGLLRVCESLAQQIVSDGEGIQHVICLKIEGARTRNDAMDLARAIAHSPLVKTAWAGADPNWGRILAACGNSGVRIDSGKINIFIGDQMVCHRGQAREFDERKAHEHLSQRNCEVRVRVGEGRHALRFYTTDLTAEYVRINAEYST